MTHIFLDVENEVASGNVTHIGWVPDHNPSVYMEKRPSLRLTRLLGDTENVLVTHSGHDYRKLRELGIDVACQLHDTQVMAWLVNENTDLDLASCVQRYLAITLDKDLQKKAGIAPWKDVAAYCQKDVEVTRELYYKLKQRLEEQGLWAYFLSVESEFTRVLRECEERGLPIDLAKSQQLEDVFQQRLDVLEAKLTLGKPSAFNLNSPHHIAAFLNQLKVKVPGKVSHLDNATQRALDELAGFTPAENWWDEQVGAFIVEKEGRLWDHGFWVVAGLGPNQGEAPMKSVERAELMRAMPHRPTAWREWVTDYLEYKKYQKLLSTYLRVFREKARAGRLHGRFNQTGTTTGRLSSSEPNLQNIPARRKEGQEVRDLFVGNLVVGDFSQLEPRLMAHFSQDPNFIAVFQQGKDVYEALALAAGCTRDVAKTLMLAMSYGAGADKIAETLTLNGYPATPSAVRGMLDRLQREFKVYFNWREKVIAESKRVGYVTTIDGRKRRLFGKDAIGTAWKDKGTPGRQAANAVVQGSAADIVRRVMLLTGKMFPDLKLLGQVHDELIWEYDPANPPDLQALEKWVLQFAGRGLTVPLEFKPHIGTSWYRAKEGI